MRHKLNTLLVLLLLLGQAACAEDAVEGAVGPTADASQAFDVALGETGEVLSDTAGTEVNACDNDKQAPVLTVQSPLEGAVTQAGEPLQVKGTAVDNCDAGQQLQLAVRVNQNAEPAATAQGQADQGFVLAIKALPAGLVSLTITATDKAGNVASKVVQVLGNTAPGSAKVTIAPELPQAGDALIANLADGAADPDRKPEVLVYSYAWRKDGVATAYATANVPAGVTKKGEVWLVEVQAADPYSKGSIAIAQVTIGNTAPSAPGAKLPSKAPLNAVLTVTVAPESTDPDGDPVTYAYEWRVNDLVVAAAAASLDLTSGKLAGGQLLAAGDVVKCTVTASDGLASASTNSNLTTLQAVDVCGTANPCHVAADCSNSKTLVAACTCKPGYSGDGKTCADVDECAVGNGGCDANAACANQAGSFSCACKPGYSGDGKACADVDECAVGNGGCDANASCANQAGSFSCACKPGYSGDGKTCADVDECAVGNGGCSANAVCSNQVGSFACACKSGFCGDGKTCAPVNACGVCACTQGASCKSAAGGASACACDPGFFGDGKTCCPDGDGDKVCDAVDNCPTVANGPSVGKSKIFVNNDEWTLTDTGFGQAPATPKYVENLANWFTGGKPGKFLAHSSNFGLAGNTLAQTMVKLGHKWTVTTTGPVSVAYFKTFDGIFVGGNPVDQQVLIDYVKSGGNVYVMAGTGQGGAEAEAAQWNKFLGVFGLQFLPQYNGIGGVFTTKSTHQVFAGVAQLYSNNGNTVVKTKPPNPDTEIIFDPGLFGLFDAAIDGKDGQSDVDKDGIGDACDPN